jgi:hypothetical protein
MLVLLMGGFYEDAGETGSGGIIHIPSFLKIGSSIQKLLREDMHTDTQT